MAPELQAEFQKAVKRENDLRDGAFYDPLTDLFGVKIRQINLLDFQILDGLDNPLIHRLGVALWPQIIFFIWLLSPHYRARSPFRAWCFTLYCKWKFRRVKYVDLIKRIWDYMDASFVDSMASEGVSHASYYSASAFWVDRMGGEYGWTREYTMSCPIRILFQLSRRISQRNDPDYRLTNRLSGLVRAKDLQQKNAKPK